MATSPPLHAHQVSAKQGGHTVLHDVSLTLQSGQRTAIVGTNGAGKSTLLRVLAGLHPCHAGAIHLFGVALPQQTARTRAQTLAWLGQHTELHSPLTVYDLVLLGRLPHHGPWHSAGASDHAAVARALHDTDTTTLAARSLASLSGGQRQRVLLARALATETPILLLDEPATYLDIAQQRRLHQALSTRQQQGVTVVTVVHDLNDALSADQLLLLEHGQVRVCGSPQDPQIRATLCAALDHALDIVPHATPQGTRWLAVPRHIEPF